jgi:glycosyltransferase involved in cell wall biosynthesis
MNDITAIILTKNEEINIKDCILSIKPYVKRIVIIDSNSTDQTVTICQKLGADVFINEYHYYSKQFNWGILNTNIETEWILRIDADERFTHELWIEIQKKIEFKDPKLTGISIEAWLYFLGKKIKFGISNKRKIMLFKSKHGYIEDIKRDAHTILTSGKVYYCTNKFIHKDFKSIASYIDRYNKYSTFEVEDYLNHNSYGNSFLSIDKLISKKRRRKYNIYYKSPMFLRAWLWFIYNYYFKLGFLDGERSKIFHFLECYWYRYLVDIKLLERIKNEDIK